jgi:hypothetical protein
MACGKTLGNELRRDQKNVLQLTFVRSVVTLHNREVVKGGYRLNKKVSHESRFVILSIH